METTQPVQQRITSYTFPGNAIDHCKQFVFRYRINLSNSQNENHMQTIEIYHDVNSTVDAVSRILKEIGDTVTNGGYVKAWYEVVAEFNVDNADMTLMSETIFETEIIANVPLYDFL